MVNNNYQAVHSQLSLRLNSLLKLGFLKQTPIVIFCCLLISCGGGGGSGAEDDNNNPVNQAPSISGSPATSITVDQSYSFSPTASDPDGDNLTFTVNNLPNWASFNTTDGMLTGTPTNNDLGDYNDIEISVSDGSLSDNLNFSIAVIDVASAENQAPSISGSMATAVEVAQNYSFVPSASDPDGDNLTFSISNLPSWASFDTGTGALIGIPVNDDIGDYNNIMISVSDGSLSDSLSFSISVVEDCTDNPACSENDPDPTNLLDCEFGDDNGLKCEPGSGPVTNSFKVMTFNVASRYSSNELDAQYATIDTADPDVIGFQEGGDSDLYYPDHYNGTKYEFFAADSRNNNPIMVNTDRFTVLNVGMDSALSALGMGEPAISDGWIEADNRFHCSPVGAVDRDTGEEKEGALMDQDRYLGWLRLEDKQSGEQYLVYNTHMVAPTFEPYGNCLHALQVDRMLDIWQQHSVDYPGVKKILTCDCNEPTSDNESTKMILDDGFVDSNRVWNQSYIDTIGTGGGYDRIFAQDLQIVNSEHNSSGEGSDHDAMTTEYDECDLALDECAVAPIPLLSEHPVIADTQDNDMPHLFSESGCYACHGSSSARANLNFQGTDWQDNLIDVPADTGGGAECGSSGYVRVKPGYPGESLLYRKVVSRNPCGIAMPDGGGVTNSYFFLKEEGAGMLHRWIRNLGNFNKQTIANPTDANVVELIAEYGCITCHGNEDGFTPEHVDLSGDIVAAMVGVVADGHECEGQGTLVIAGNATDSILYQKVSGDPSVCGATMPFGATMDDADAQTIANWINNM